MKINSDLFTMPAIVKQISAVKFESSLWIGLIVVGAFNPKIYKIFIRCFELNQVHHQ